MSEYLDKIEKPWGHEIIWAKSCSETGYVGKILFIKAGHRLSLQYHEEKEETIFVKSGTLYIETVGEIGENESKADILNNDRKTIRLCEGETFHVSPFMTHRFIANECNVELIEVSTKQLDDVVRVEDDYGR